MGDFVLVEQLADVEGGEVGPVVGLEDEGRTMESEEVAQAAEGEACVGMGHGPGQELAGTGQVADSEDEGIEAVDRRGGLGKVSRPDSSGACPDEVLQPGIMIVQELVPQVLECGAWGLGEEVFECREAKPSAAFLKQFVNLVAQAGLQPARWPAA